MSHGLKYSLTSLTFSTYMLELKHEAERAPAYPLLSAAIKTGSRLAIWLSERL